MWMSSLLLAIHNFGVPNFDPYFTHGNSCNPCHTCPQAKLSRLASYCPCYPNRCSNTSFPKPLAEWAAQTTPHRIGAIAGPPWIFPWTKGSMSMAAYALPQHGAVWCVQFYIICIYIYIYTYIYIYIYMCVCDIVWLYTVPMYCIICVIRMQMVGYSALQGRHEYHQYAAKRINNVKTRIHKPRVLY